MIISISKRRSWFSSLYLPHRSVGKRTHLAHTWGRGSTRCSKRDQTLETFPFWRTLGQNRPNWELPARPCWLCDTSESLSLFFLLIPNCAVKIGSPPTRSADSPPSPQVWTVKGWDTEALLLIPLISTASTSSSSSPPPPTPSALRASC